MRVGLSLVGQVGLLRSWNRWCYSFWYVCLRKSILWLFRTRRCLRKRKWLRAMHVNRVVFVEWLLLYAWVWVWSVRLGCWEVSVVDVIRVGICYIWTAWGCTFFGYSRKKAFAQTQIVARNACEQGSIRWVVIVVRVGLSLVRLGCWEVGIVVVPMVVSVLEKVHFVVFRVRRCLRKRKWLRAVAFTW